MRRIFTLFVPLIFISWLSAAQISPSGTLTALSTTYGTASSSTSFSFSANITGNETVTVTPPTGFEVSLDNTTFTATVTKQANGGGNIGATTVYVRLKANATVAGSPYSGNVSLSGDLGATTQTIATASSTVTTKALTMSGLSVPASKVYDGTTTAVVSGSPGSLQTAEAFGAGNSSDGKPYTGDVVSITGSAAGTYNSKNVASATTVTFSGLSLTGAQAGNYTLTIQSAASATITTKTLTVTGLSVPASKIYDGATAAVVSGSPALQTSEAAGAGSTSDGIPYTGDAVSITGTPAGTYNSKDVASATTVTYSGMSLTGGDATNYSLNQGTTGATITAKALTMSGLSVPGSKIYDGSTAAVVSGSPGSLQAAEAVGAGNTSDGKPYTGDVVSTTGSATGTYNNKNVASATSVTYSGISLTGAQATNYSLTQQSASAATITAKALTMSGLSVPASKVYDGNTTAVVSGGPGSLQAAEAVGAGNTSDGKPYTGDAVSITGSAAGTYNSQDVVSATTVTYSGLSLTGAEAGNYTLTIQGTSAATITTKTITITGISINNKIFDGGTSATIAGTPTPVGVVGVEDVTIGGSPTATFTSAGPGTAIPVNVSGYALAGTATLTNYSLTQPTGLTANITSLTTVAQVTGGVTSTATINSSTGTVALLGFSLNNPNSTGNFTGLTLTTTADPSTLFSSISLVSSADNTYDIGDAAVTATVNTTSSTIAFTSITGQSITTGATFYYFLKVTLKPFFSTVDPTIKISFAPSTDIAFSGGIAGTGGTINTINGANSSYTLHDDQAPTITSITNNVSTIYQGALVQTVVVKFSETMTNSGFNPVIAFSAGTWPAQAAGSWSQTTYTDDTYTTTFTHSAAVEERFTNVTSGVSTMTAKDITGNVVSNTFTSAGNFLLDTERPTVTVTRNAVSTGSFTQTTDNSVSFNIDFSEVLSSGTFTAADITVNTTGTVAHSSDALTGSNNQNFVYTVNNITGDGNISLSFGTGYADVPGNAAVAFGPSSAFTIDNAAPTVAITLVSASPSTATSLDFTVTFNESVTGVDISDFVLATGTANDATGTISNLTGSGAVYTVTVSSIVGQYTNSTQAILNLDLVGSPGISDGATNSFGGSVTTDNQYLVDNTKPTVVQNDFTFNANGTGAETIVFSVSETLNGSLTNNITGFTIGGTTGNGTTAPVGVYNSGTGQVTLTNSGSDGTWGTGVTVTYTPGNMSDLLGNTMNAIGATAVTVPSVTLAAGDIAFTSINTKGTPNGFSFVILKNLPASTKIFFTNRGWNGTSLQASGTDMTWTSPASVTNAGTEIYFADASGFLNSSGSAIGTTSGTSLDLDSNGDQVLAYQGSLNSPLQFIAAINASSDGTLGGDNWNTSGSVGTDANRSALPTGLTEGTNALSLSQLNSVNVLDNAQYKPSAVTQEGSAQQLRTSMCTSSNWNNQNNTAYASTGVTYKIRPVITAVSIPNSTMLVGNTVTATITVHDDRGSAHTLLTSNVGGFTLGSLSRTNSTTYTATFTIAEGGTDVAAGSNIPLSVDLQSAQGNATAAAGTTNPSNTVQPWTTAISQASDPIDAHSPYVVSITRQTTTTAWSTTSGTSASSVVFRITFSENMASGTLTSADFSIPVSPLGGITGASITNIATVTGTSVFDITVGSYSGTGTLGLNYRDSEVNVAGASVTDLLGNTTKTSGGAADGSMTGPTYSIVLPEPTNEVFTVSPSGITQNSVTLNWNSSVTTPLPTSFLVLAKATTGGSYPTVETPTVHTAIADGTVVGQYIAKNVTRVAGANSYTFNGLNSGTSYDFRVYKYANSTNYTSDNIDYETTAPADCQATTNTAAVSWITLNGTATAVSSSTNIDKTTGAQVMQFKIYDDGLDPISPNVMNFNDNGTSAETITFTLTEQLTLTAGALMTGFSASTTGVVANAVYSGPATNIVTLTSPFDGAWNSSTTISYSATTGNATFVTLGKMQSIQNHDLSAATPTTVSISTTGLTSFNVPAGVTSVIVEVWGAGGSGGPVVNNAAYGGASSGGGGGAYSRRLLSVTPGNNYNVFVGSGGPAILGTTSYVQAGNDGQDSWFGNTSLVFAEGGQGGWNNDWTDYYGVTIHSNTSTRHGLGGQDINGVGDLKYSGGNGGYGYDGGSIPGSNAGVFGTGGGGGSSAGNASDGNNGNNGVSCCGVVGGAAPVGGGAGGIGWLNSAGNPGNSPGGGGGGTGGFGPYFSGAGANGQVKVTYYSPAGSGTSDWAGDNSPFKFNKLIFTPGPGNNNTYFNDLTKVIGGAVLTDGTASLNSTDNPANVVIGATSITFQNVPCTTSADLGYVTDAVGTTSFKTYTLKVWLRTDMPATQAANADGKNLEMTLDVATNLTYDDITNSAQKSSRLSSPEPSFNSGTGQVQVVASQLVYRTPGPIGTSTNTNPQATIGVGIPFSSSTAQDPEVYALDAYNNLDLDYTTASGNSGTITNPLQGFGQSIGSISFTNGVALLNPFTFTTGSSTTLNTQIVVSGNGSPAVAAATSTNVWPVISSQTTVATGPLSEPASISSLTTALTGAAFPQTNAAANFDFTVSDDVGVNTSTYVDNDALPTTFNQIVITQGAGTDAAIQNKWDKIIAGAELRLTSTTGTQLVPQVVSSNVTIGTNTITFGSILSGVGNPGRVDDGKSNTYQLKIYFKNPVDPTMQDIIDNQHFEFAVSNNDFNPTGLTSIIASTSTTSMATVANSNKIDVAPYQIDFVTQWAAPSGLPLVYANQNYDAPLSPNPTAKVHDANGNLDTDYNTAVTATAFDSDGAGPKTYPVTNSAVTINNGLISFSTTPQIASSGNGTNGDITHLILSSGSGPVYTGSSYDFKLNYSGNSDIIRKVSYTHPTNIDYGSTTGQNNQTSDITATTGQTIETFTVRDGGGSSDADGSTTVLDAISFNIQNSGYLRKIALYNNSNLEVAEITVSGSTASFSGLASATNKIIAPDNGNIDFTVKVSFQSTVVDNSVVNLNVTSVTAGGVSSSFTAGVSTTMPSLAANENKIAVTATQLDITTPATAANASINTAFPGGSSSVVVQARDVHSNLDTDFTGKITSVTNAITGTMTGTGGIAIGTAGSGIQFGTSAFSGGLFSFPTAFQFTSGTNGQIVTLTVKADNLGGNSGVTCGTDAICADPSGTQGISPVITLTTSFESSIQGDPTFTAPSKIAYVSHQESTLTNSSYELARVVLVDGSRTSTSKYLGSVKPGGTANFSSTDSGDGQAHGDNDGSFTALTSLTISVTNPSNLRTIGLFDASGNPVGSQIDVKALNLTNPSSSQNFNFTGSPLITAPDDSSAVFSIRVSFNNTATTVKDLDDISVSLVAAAVGTGSQLFNGNPANSGLIGGFPITFLAGHDATQLTPTSYGKVDVVATSLDFLTQPSAYAGVNEPVGTDPTTSLPYVSAPLQSTGAGVVKARDKFALVDTEFSPVTGSLSGATTGSVTIPASVAFVNGVVNLAGIQYTASGNGTLTAAIKRAATGTITTSTSSTSVTGVGTYFLSDLTPGMIIYDYTPVLNVIGTVQSISSNTSLTLTSNAGVALAGSNYLAELNSSKANRNTTGTITASTGSATVTGSGTLFTTELAVGSIINDTNGTPVGTVASISSNTSLTLNSNAAIALSGASYNTNAIFSSHVDVLDVTVTYDNSNGVVPPTTNSPPGASLKGGVAGYNIFGLKFTATNDIAGSDPAISEFTINFDVPFESGGKKIFSGFVVKEVKETGTFDITSGSIGGSWTPMGPSPGVYDKIKVTLPSAQSLAAETSKSISFFLYANVDATVDLSTPAITPYFSDKGYPNADNANSVMTEGTSHGVFTGNKYSFASTQPPVLLTSKTDLTSPYAGQPNVDPYLDKITLQFNTNVGSLDAGGPGNAELWSRSTNAKVADLLFNSTQSLATVNPNNTVNNIYATLLYDVTDPNNYGAPLPTPLNADEVYYVTLIKGNYDAVNGIGSGITDFGLNFYGGISSNSVLYFKISSANAPKLASAKSSFNTTTLGTLTTKFDQFGTAFYMIVKSGTTIPTAAQIMDPTARGLYLTSIGSALGAYGNYAITAINADQTYTFTASFVANQGYDVYIIAQNDAVSHGVPSPVVAAGVYGSAANTYTAGSTGPTTTIPASGTGSISTSISSITPNLANSNFLICPDSYYTITSPIIIAETQSPAVVSFAKAGNQDFNILLPTGYQFDVSVTPNVQLFGADFSPLIGSTYWKFNYTSNTVLNISFKNTTSTNPNDFIVVSGLSVIGKTGSSQGVIQWFYGNNVFTGTAASTFSLGTIALQTVTPVDFVNSYWQSNRALFNAIEPPSTPSTPNAIGDALDKTVNAVPDNYLDRTFPGQVQLIPDSRTFSSGDYLASIFSGNGVSGDLFTLNSVSTGAPFNITITHTDLNGCVTQKAEQYLVYDHRNTISNKLGLAYPSPSPLAGTEQALLNANWPNTASSITSPILNYNELAGYSLQKLVVDLPSNEIALNQTIPPTATQLMAGSAWRNLVQNSVLSVNAASPLSYKWDYSAILNANAATVQSSVDPNQIFNTVANANTAATDVYDYFKAPNLSPQKNNYWLGGSLGKVEFTGIYQSTADGSVYNPFRQNVELFVPAVPVVEVTSPIPTPDPTDAATGANSISVQSLGSTNKIYNNLYPGTSVFCEQGGTVNINGYPAPTGGVSVGGFGIYDYASYDFTKVIVPSGTISAQKNGTAVFGTNTKFTTELVVGASLFDPQGNAIGQVATIFNDTQLALAAPGSPLAYNLSAFRANLNSPIPNNLNGFVDNQNGSMTLDPLKIKNTYKDILVAYMYQETTSPAYGIGYLVIRVTPNPLPAFTIASAVTNPGSSIFSASCKDNPIQFDASASTIGGVASNPSNTNYVANYAWDFGDPGSGSPNQPSILAGTPGGPGATQIPSQYVQQLPAPQVQYFDKPVHIFGVSNTYTVNLTLTSNWRCPSVATSTIINPTPQTSNLLYSGSSGAIKVGENPQPSFTVAKNCVGDQITFDASASKMPSGGSSNSQIQKWNWDYNHQFAGNPYNANNLPNPVPATSPLTTATGAQTVYSQSGFYDVQLTTVSTLGCQQSIDKPISQLAVTIPFNQYFDSNDGGWQMLDLNTNNSATKVDYTPVPTGTSNPNVSWSWGNTTGRANSIYNSVNALWSTSATKITPNLPAVNGQGSYYSGEKSALISPCLNLDPAVVPRPMISYSGFVDVATGDGLVLQYSTDDYNIMDPNKKWTNLGGVGTGLEWYTSVGLPSSPGTNAFNTTGLGWSGNGIDGSAATANTTHEWIHPKHALDMLSSATQKVILRFAFANAGSNTYNKDGVAIDSVFFGSRTRTILFESFTSTDGGASTPLSTQIKSENDYIRTFVQNNINSTQLVDINYHVGFVGNDPFAIDNSSDPGARALYYGVKNIPFAFLDGKHYQGQLNGKPSDLFQTWGQAEYDLNTLQLAKADFNNVVTQVAGGLKIDVAFTPLFDLPIGVGKTTLHVAILEKSIAGAPGYGSVTTGENSFEYVLKQMLPSAVGTQFTSPIQGPTAGPVYHPVNVGTFYYTPKNMHSTTLTVVVFLQNETTQEVYQADLIDNIVVNVVTAVEPTAENIKLYPNPADHELTVELPSAVKEKTSLRLANQWGQFTEMADFNEGEQKKTISTRDLAEGVYILQLGSGNSAVRSKVVVIHK